MADLDLDAIEARAAAATSGPWYPWDRGVGWHIATKPPTDGRVPPILPEGSRTDIGCGEDAEFIAAARTDVPALSAEVRRLRTRVAELEAAAGLRRDIAEDACARANAAEKRAAELEWIENTSCCGSEAGRYGVRARNAEAAVERVRAELDAVTAEILACAEHPFGGGASEAVRQGMARVANGIREALDAAGTPAGGCENGGHNMTPNPTPDASPQVSAVTDAMVRAAIVEYFELEQRVGGYRTDDERMRAALEAALAAGTPAAEPDDTQPCGATSHGTRCNKPAGHQTHRGTVEPGRTRWWTDTAAGTPAETSPTGSPVT